LATGGIALKTGPTGEITEVDGRLTLPFEDGEGQRLVLVDDGGAGPASPWEKSPVPSEHQIRGLGPIVLNVHDLSHTARLLTDVMNMRKVRDYAAPDAPAQIHVFAMGGGGPAAELHVIEGKGLPVARQGAGGVHHVAFRTPDEAQYHAWTQRLTEHRISNSGEIDRFYFSRHEPRRCRFRWRPPCCNAGHHWCRCDETSVCSGWASPVAQ
jgi:glyoxalase family protein